MTANDQQARLSSALAAAGRAAATAADPWWIIGSAALLLHEVDPGPVGDVDLLMSARDAAALLTASGMPATPGRPDERFRSAVFGRWTVQGVAVEVMGGLALHGPRGWRPVRLATRRRVVVDGAALFVPTRSELAALFRRFGREKDALRAALLDRAAHPAIPRSAGPNASGSSCDSR